MSFAAQVVKKKWSYSFEDIEPHIINAEMKKRLFVTCYQYWEKKNNAVYPYSISTRDKKTREKVRELFRCKDEKCGYEFKVIKHNYDKKEYFFKNLEEALKHYN